MNIFWIFHLNTSSQIFLMQLKFHFKDWIKITLVLNFINVKFFKKIKIDLIFAYLELKWKKKWNKNESKTYKNEKKKTSTHGTSTDSWLDSRLQCRRHRACICCNRGTRMSCTIKTLNDTLSINIRCKLCGVLILFSSGMVMVTLCRAYRNNVAERRDW